MSRHNDDIPTNPGTPRAMNPGRLRVELPSAGRLTSGELRNFITIFTTMGSDIEILEKRADEQDKLIKNQSSQILVLQQAVGRIESTCSKFSDDLEKFMTEIRRETSRFRK